MQMLQACVSVEPMMPVQATGHAQSATSTTLPAAKSASSVQRPGEGLLAAQHHLTCSVLVELCSAC